MASLRNIDFIQEEPFTPAYQRAVTFGDNRRGALLTQEGQALRNQSEADLAPSRLRSAEARATTAEVGAEFARPNAQAGLRSANAAAQNAEMQGFYKSLELLNAGQTEAAIAVAARTGHPIQQSVIDNAEVRERVTQTADRAQKLYPNRPRDQQVFIQSNLQAHADQAQMRQQHNANRAPDEAPLERPARDPAAAYRMPAGAPEPSETSSTQHNYEIVHRQETQPDGRVVTRAFKHDKRTGSMEPVEGEGAFTRSTGSGAGAGRPSVYQQRLTVGESLYGKGSQAAADYASGRRTLTEADISKFAIAQAGRDAAGDRMMGYNSAKRKEFINQRTQEITQSLRATGGYTPSVPNAPGTAQSTTAPAQQRPDMMTPGDGGRPIQFQEGATATNPNNGQRIIFRNGQWVPLQ